MTLITKYQSSIILLTRNYGGLGNDNCWVLKNHNT